MAISTCKLSNREVNVHIYVFIHHSSYFAHWVLLTWYTEKYLTVWWWCLMVYWKYISTLFRLNRLKLVVSMVPKQTNARGRKGNLHSLLVFANCNVRRKVGSTNFAMGMCHLRNSVSHLFILESAISDCFLHRMSLSLLNQHAKPQNFSSSKSSSYTLKFCVYTKLPQWLWLQKCKNPSTAIIS